jgi:hypothetical protein
LGGESQGKEPQRVHSYIPYQIPKRKTSKLPQENRQEKAPKSPKRENMRVLTVNFRQPSHEFTFGVGIDLISKLTILTLMIHQVRTRMWFLKFIVYVGF